MRNSTADFENPRAPRPVRPSDLPTDAPWTRTEAGQRESIRIEGMKIGQTAVQSIGMDTRDPWGAPKRLPDYALAVSLLFTKATNQTIILGTPPKHVLSTSILWSSLAHDKRFEQVPMNEAAPGDIVIGSGRQQGADGYAGIVVDHGRIVSNSGQGVQDNSSLLEIQRSHPGMIAYRYVGFWNYYRSKPLANAGFNADEPRLPAGQPGGGQWTTGGAGGVQMAPSTTVLSGANNWTPGERKPRSGVENRDADAHGNPHAGGPLTDAQRKLLEQKNAEAVAIIARLGDEGENPDTPESILNGPLKSVWGSNLGWMPATAKWDLRQQYKGYSDKDIALMEAARRNGVRASTLLAQAGKLPESQVTALRLRGLGVLADATLNIAMALAPYESITALGSKALLGAGEVAVGTGVKDIASQLESSGLDLRVGAKPKLPKMPKAVVADYWSRYPYFNVNPARGINNCANSAIALEATLAGRLASALPGDGMGMSIPEFESAFGNRFFNVTGRKDIEDLLNKSDARGVVLGMRERSSHAFNAVNIDGTIYYINGANGGDAAYSFSRYKYFRLAITNRGTRIKNAH